MSEHGVKVMVTVSTQDRGGAEWRSKTLTIAMPTHEQAEAEWRGFFVDFLHRAIQNGADPEVDDDADAEVTS